MSSSVCNCVLSSLLDQHPFKSITKITEPFFARNRHLNHLLDVFTMFPKLVILILCLILMVGDLEAAKCDFKKGQKLSECRVQQRKLLNQNGANKCPEPSNQAKIKLPQAAKDMFSSNFWLTNGNQQYFQSVDCNKFKYYLDSDMRVVLVEGKANYIPGTGTPFGPQGFKNYCNFMAESGTLSGTDEIKSCDNGVQQQLVPTTPTRFSKSKNAQVFYNVEQGHMYVIHTNPLNSIV